MRKQGKNAELAFVASRPRWQSTSVYPKPFAFIVVSALIRSYSFFFFFVEHGDGAEKTIRGDRPPAGV